MNYRTLLAMSVLLVAGFLAGCDDESDLALSPMSNNAQLASFTYSNPAPVDQPVITAGVFHYTNEFTGSPEQITVSPVAADTTATIRIRSVKSDYPTNNAFTVIPSGGTRTYDMPYNGYTRVAFRGQIFEVQVVSQSQSVTNLYEFIMRDSFL